MIHDPYTFYDLREHGLLIDQVGSSAAEGRRGMRDVHGQND